MTTVTGTLKTILKNPSSVTGVMIRAHRLRPTTGGVTTGEMEAVDWNPTNGAVTFDAEPGEAYLILQMQGRPESISISIPDAPTATLREVIEKNYVFDPPVVLAAQQAAASAADTRIAAMAPMVWIFHGTGTPVLTNYPGARVNDIIRRQSDGQEWRVDA